MFDHLWLLELVVLYNQMIYEYFKSFVIPKQINERSLVEARSIVFRGRFSFIRLHEAHGVSFQFLIHPS